MSTGGLYIPEEARETKTQGIVVQRGPNPNAQDFDIGEEVLFTQHNETRMKIDGEPRILIDAENVVMRSKEPKL